MCVCVCACDGHVCVCVCVCVQEEADGKEYLYHANNAATVTKTTLDGHIVWSTDMTSAWSHNSTHWPFKPTDLLISPKV